MLLAVDPGANTGWALFDSEWLCLAGYGSHEDVRFRCCSLTRIDTLVVEMPRHYPHKCKGDPNDLIDLASKAGEIWGSTRCPNKFYVHPVTWKGSVPKDIHHRRVLAALSAAEIEQLPKSPRAKKYNHNMLDAVGLGLWHLERMTR